MTAGERHSGITYQPALDGLRAVSVVLVLLFHSGVPWMRGGYLGVSVFFTLSGFLITLLLLEEHHRTHRVSLANFYARRVRRLLPASLICLAAIVVAYWAGEFRFVAGMRRQLIGALAQVYNWVRIDGSSSYADLFARAPALTSPLEHYWSLAIEEQFYLVWPIVAWAIIRFCLRRGRDTFVAFGALAAVFAISSPVVAKLTSPEFAYWSTPTRLSELLVGATAAAWLHRGAKLPSRSSQVSIVATLLVVILAIWLPSDSGPAYSGGMAPIALLSAALILSLQVVGPVQRWLSLSPVVWIGRVSYGVYLFHWPVFVVLRAHGWRLDQFAGLALALAATFAIAAASFYAVELPVRSSAWPPQRTFVVAAAGFVAIAVTIAVTPVSRGFLEVNRRTLEEVRIEPVEPGDTLAPLTEEIVPTTSASDVDVVSTTSTSPSPEPLTVALPATPNRPVRILLAGDSTASSVGEGIAAWAAEHSGYAQLDVLWCAGCGFMQGGKIVNFGGAEKQSAIFVAQDLPQRVELLMPDVVVLMTSVDDIATREWSAAEGPLTPFDTAFRERLRQSYGDVTEGLLGLGVRTVVWIVPPVPNGKWPFPELHEVARYEIQHDVIREVATAIPGASYIDLDQWMTSAGHIDEESWRPDGTHFAEAAATELAATFLGPRLVRAALSATTV